MEAYAMTDVGRVRSRNQDYVYCSPDPVGSLENLFLVADGMGGHRAGDYASRFMAEGLNTYVSKHRGASAVKVLGDGIRQINGELYDVSMNNSALSGMGTTLVAATTEGNTLYVANVGDSRLYLLRDKHMIQVTRDHSYVEEMVALGQMERNSRDYLQRKNIITRAVGVRNHVEADFFEEELLAGDLILMCSDGLTDMLEDREIFKIIEERKDTQSIVDELVIMANEHGGNDNITVILTDPFAEDADWR